MMAAKLKVFSWIERVESRSNIADGPTKCRHDTLNDLNAREVTPDVSLIVYFSTPHISFITGLGIAKIFRLELCPWGVVKP